MGANSGSRGMGGGTADAGKQAMMEAMMRKQREEQVTNAQRSPSGSTGMGGRTADAGKQAMMEAMMREQEAMMRKQREEQVTNAQRSPVNADFRPGLEPDYRDMEANNRYSGLKNRSNVEAANLNNVGAFVRQQEQKAAAQKQYEVDQRSLYEQMFPDQSSRNKVSFEDATADRGPAAAREKNNIGPTRATSSLFNMPAKGGISMGPGRSSRYTDEEAQELMRRAQEQRR